MVIVPPALAAGRCCHLRATAEEGGALKLHSGTPYWLATAGSRPSFPPLAESITCDVGVIGAGLTGALVADVITREGMSVAVLDKREAGAGSTGASTALLQYDTDVPLHRLVARMGREYAERVFAIGVRAIASLEARCAELGAPFERLPSLHFTSSQADLPELRAEFEARRLAGLDVEWLGRRSLRAEWGLVAAGAIRSGIAAQTDPHTLCVALLSRAAARGARVHDGTAVEAIEERGERREMRTRAGHSVLARHVVHAGGYEAASLLPSGLVELNSTYAIASEPVRGARPARCTMWELASPYLYARWAGDRLLVGGEDEPFTSTAAQDALIQEKARRLATRFAALMPGVRIEPSYAWSGPFASTPDGLGYIGAGTRDPRVLFALGFGGNGLTFAAAAADILADIIARRDNDDAGLFAFGRESLAR